MNTQQTIDQNRALILVAEQTRKTIKHYQAEIERMEAWLAETLNLAGHPNTISDDETQALAAKFRPVSEVA